MLSIIWGVDQVCKAILDKIKGVDQVCLRNYKALYGVWIRCASGVDQVCI